MVNVNDTIAAGKVWLRARLDKGAPCPLCGQRAQMYNRKIHSSVAKALIQMWKMEGCQYVHIPTILPTQRGGDMVKLVYWGLLEEEKTVRPDGGRAGYWRVTDKGVAFLKGQLHIPTYAQIYNGKLQGFTGDPVDIRGALGTKFNYDELMRGV